VSINFSGTPGLSLVGVFCGAGVVSPVPVGVLVFEWENAGSPTVTDSLAGKACFKTLETVGTSSRNIRSPSTSLELCLCTFETTATFIKGVLAALTACRWFRTLEVLDQETNTGGGNVKVQEEEKKATEELTIGGHPIHYSFFQTRSKLHLDDTCFRTKEAAWCSCNLLGYEGLSL